jgi:hypothetical protein
LATTAAARRTQLFPLHPLPPLNVGKVLPLFTNWPLWGLVKNQFCRLEVQSIDYLVISQNMEAKKV